MDSVADGGQESSGSEETSLRLSNHIHENTASEGLQRRPRQDGQDEEKKTPVFLHRMKHNKSILALAVSPEYIFAGTQGGEILVYRVDTFERELIIAGHRSSVLGLCYSQHDQLLFSSAADRMVHVWDAQRLKRKYSVFSAYDIGDVFCVSYSSILRTLYLGAQNTSIQWYDLKEKDLRPVPKSESHPYYRADRFFDSTGPGGYRAPRSAASIETAETNLKALKLTTGSQSLEVDKQNVCQFAHYGYVYCMLLGKGLVSGKPEKECLVSGGGDGIIKIWSLAENDSGKICEMCKLESERGEGCSVLSMVIDGTILYSGLLDGEINVWDLETKQLVRRMQSHKDDVLTMTVGGGYLFSGGAFGFLDIFNRQHECVARREVHKGQILASAFSNYVVNRPLLITGGNDNDVAVWDARDCIPSPLADEKTSEDQLVESLRLFVSYHTVSSDPKQQLACRRGASWLRMLFSSLGAVTEMLTTDGSYNPVVFARFRGNPKTSAERRKILFYGHYDVIAAQNDNKTWKTDDPFVLEGIDGNLYGRGATDNKGPIVAAAHAVGELNLEQRLESDIVFLIEGEEECGSRGFAEAIKRNRKLIGEVDWILLANSYWLDDLVPCLTYGLRGVIHATVQVESAQPDLHSGLDGSSSLDEPLKDLVTLLSKLTGPKGGKIAIPGFEDPILPFTVEEDQFYEDIIKHITASNPDLSNQQKRAEDLKKKWREPSLTIHRFHTSGPENLTVIPRLAKVNISLRLVPYQEADAISEALKNFLYTSFDELHSKNNVNVDIDHRGDPWLGNVNNQIYKILEKAIVDVWNTSDTLRQRRKSTGKIDIRTRSGYRRPSSSGKLPFATSSTLAKGAIDRYPEEAIEKSSIRPVRPLYIREGGSIPAIRFLEKEFNAPAAQLPCGQASDSAHLDNEKIRLLNLYKSKDIFKRVFTELPRKPGPTQIA